MKTVGWPLRWLVWSTATWLVVSSMAVAWLFLDHRTAFPQGAARDPGHVRLNKVIDLFERQLPAFGILVSDPTVRKAVELASSDLDFVLVDMEHAPLDFERLEAFVASLVDRRRLAQKGNLQLEVAPLVRLAPYGREKLQFLIKQALDLGVYGIMFPYVESAEEALAAVQASRYPQPRGAKDREPTGQRGAAYGYAARLWGLSPAEYARRADIWPLDPEGELVLMVQIESQKGLENLDHILAVPGVSSIFIGPNDLAFSLGVEVGSREHEAAVQRILAACKARGIPCGITATEQTAAQRLKEGFRFLTLGSDGGLSEEVSSALRVAREASQRH
jgi:4-hydroxy-2-oxoheptanedioate aldolase